MPYGDTAAQVPRRRNRLLHEMGRSETLGHNH